MTTRKNSQILNHRTPLLLPVQIRGERPLTVAPPLARTFKMREASMFNKSSIRYMAFRSNEARRLAKELRNASLI